MGKCARLALREVSTSIMFTAFSVNQVTRSVPLFWLDLNMPVSFWCSFTNVSCGGGYRRPEGLET